MEALRDVWDPELGIGLVSLGLIYDIRVDEMGLVVDMTLTTPGGPVPNNCPAKPPRQFDECCPQYPVRVDIVREQLWTPERISEDALVALGIRK